MRVENSKLILTKQEWLDIGEKAGWKLDDISLEPAGWDDNIQGGLADDECICSIAEEHGVDVGLVKSQLKMGIKVEMEHTDDPKLAREIAMDHLVEDPNYYAKLKKMEGEN
jgi:hypothetical protein